MTARRPIGVASACRTCHNLHQSYTEDDWSLRTTDPVQLIAFAGDTYDGGEGNLCATCHQPRRVLADPDENGIIPITSSHWGPHHGPQSAMLMGIGGGGDVAGSPAMHLNLIGDSCVSCHLGEDQVHTFEPQLSACTGCHSDAENFDINGLQTEVMAMAEELKAGLEALGYLDEDGHPVVSEPPAAQAAAAWNYIFVVLEDKSKGAHNPSYTKALLQQGLDSL